MERLKTGIQGFDEMLEGGIPRGSTVILSGGPGSGKTTFAMQFLLEGATRYGEKVVYMSLSEDPAVLGARLKSSFDWDIPKLVDEGSLIMMKVEVYDFEHLVSTIEDMVGTYGATRLVIDPITVLELFFDRALEIRRSLIQIDTVLKRLGCTTIMTSDHMEEGETKLESQGVYVMDGLVHIKTIREGNFYSKGLLISNMRGTDFDRGARPMAITGRGVLVYADEEVF